MMTLIFWIDAADPWRLATMARPRGGDWLGDEIAAWRSAGIDQVVSLLEPEEADLLDLRDESAECRRLDIGFRSFPIADVDVPASFEATRSLAAWIADRCMAGDAVAVYCRAGIGRSSIIAGAALIMGGLDASGTHDAIGTARGLRIPDTRAQRNWLFEFERHVRG